MTEKRKPTARGVIEKMTKDQLIDVLQKIEKRVPGLTFDVLTKDLNYDISGAGKSSYFRDVKLPKGRKYKRPDWLDR